MPIFHDNLEELTLNNNFFRQVLSTNKHSQLVLMSLKPGEEIGTEIHDDIDQFIRIEAGEGKAVLNGQKYDLSDGMSVIVPAGTEHNVVNTSSDQDLKLYTIYSPPEHKDGTAHQTKAEALADEHDHYH